MTSTGSRTGASSWDSSPPQAARDKAAGISAAIYPCLVLLIGLVLLVVSLCLKFVLNQVRAGAQAHGPRIRVVGLVVGEPRIDFLEEFETARLDEPVEFVDRVCRNPRVVGKAFESWLARTLLVEIERLADQGFSLTDISERLKVPQGEVDLVLKLKHLSTGAVKKKIPPPA